MGILGEGADYLKVEVRIGNRTRTVELHADGDRKIEFDMDVDADTVDAPTGPAGMVETHLVQQRVRLTAAGPAGKR